jgi:hypothetical protein
MADSENHEGQCRRSLVVRIVRAITLFGILPLFLLANACSALLQEQRGRASSGFLTARVMLVNPGAMSDYVGSVWVLPRYTPRIWPFDLLLGCPALTFESDPRIEVEWESKGLVIVHDAFAYPVHKRDRCYGRSIRFEERRSEPPLAPTNLPSFKVAARVLIQTETLPRNANGKIVKSELKGLFL